MDDRSEPGPNANVFALFEAAAIAHADRAFLVINGAPLLSYRAMLAQTARAAAWLRSIGVERGARALVQVHKSPAAVILYLACLRAGVVFIPLNTAYQAAELAYFLGDAEPALLVASPGLPAQGVAFEGRRVLIAGDLPSAPWSSTQVKCRPSRRYGTIRPPCFIRRARRAGPRERC